MSLLYLSLGSNRGDRADLIEEAYVQISTTIGPIVARSPVFETKPWGFASPYLFLNACAAVETTISPLDCLLHLNAIEKRLGRTRTADSGYVDRTMDLDMLLYDDLILETPDLILPHPHLHERSFVLEPLVSIAPHLKHPLLHQTMSELLEVLNAQS